MSKSRERDPGQLQLRVFAQVDGGLLRADARQTSCSSVQSESSDPKAASAEDRAIYDAIVERYFSSER
jgi:hypothetical protein